MKYKFLLIEVSQEHLMICALIVGAVWVICGLIGGLYAVAYIKIIEEIEREESRYKSFGLSIITALWFLLWFVFGPISLIRFYRLVEWQD